MVRASDDGGQPGSQIRSEGCLDSYGHRVDVPRHHLPDSIVRRKVEQENVITPPIAAQTSPKGTEKKNGCQRKRDSRSSLIIYF